MADAHIVALLDRTGSMQAIRAETEGAFDAFIEQQQKETEEIGDTVVVSLYQFDKASGAPVVETVYENKPLSEVPPLKLVPGGLTPLNDAMGLTINRVKPNGKVIMVVMTDGQENASTKYTTEQVRRLVDEKRTQGWEFVFLGVGIDGFAVGGALGFAAADTVSTPHTGEGTRTAYTAATSSVSTYRRSAKKGKDDQ